MRSVVVKAVCRHTFSLRHANFWTCHRNPHGKRAVAFSTLSRPSQEPSQRASETTPSVFTFACSPSLKLCDFAHITKGLRTHQLSSYKSPLVVILATTGFLSLLEGRHELVQALLKQVFRDSAASQHIAVLIAVIDGVHLPKDVPPSRVVSERVTQFDAYRDRNNYHGISVAVLDAYPAVPNIQSSKDANAAPARDGALPHLTFEFPYVAPLPATLQVPLANTIFKNGKISTMNLQRWSTAKPEDDTIEFELERSEEVVQQAVTFPNRSTLGISSKLQRITKPRTIVASSGNIVRQVADDSGASQPASHELEKVIKERVHAGQSAGGPVEVWALVTPQSSTDTLKPSGDEAGLQLLHFSCGSRLFKVLSGGGGWGQKQGLLALDPAIDFRGRSMSPPDERGLDESEIYAELIRPGEWITFLSNDLADLGGKDEGGEAKRLPKEVSQMHPDVNTVQFGCVPSNIDDMPISAEHDDPSRKDLPHLLVDNYFGCLSSKGVYLQLGEAINHGCTQTPQTGTRTKLDAPRSTILITDGPARESAPHVAASKNEFPHMIPRTAGASSLDGFQWSSDKDADLAEDVRSDDDDDDGTDLSASDDDTETRLQSLERSYRHRKLNQDRNGNRKVRMTPTSTSDEDILELGDADIESDDARNSTDRAPHTGGPGSRKSTQADPSLDTPFRISKFTALRAGKKVQKAFGKYVDSTRQMSENDRKLYEHALLQGATTAQALERISRDLDDLKQPPKSHKGKQKDTLPFRITRHPSMSQVGEAIEKHAGNNRAH